MYTKVLLQRLINWESRKAKQLYQLPSACGLQNVSSSNCSNLAPTSSPGPSSNVASGAYKLHITLPVEALVLLAMIAFLLPFPNGLGFCIFA